MKLSEEGMWKAEPEACCGSYLSCECKGKVLEGN